MSPQKDYGYDVSDFRDIDPDYGVMADFDALLDKAHKLGLKIIIDLVMSHTSDQHEWFKESHQSRDNPKANWYVWADPKDDGSVPNNWQSVFGGPAWTFHTGRSQYYMHCFLREQPDLNFNNPDVQDAMLDTAKFWLDKGVDGFRLDALNHCFCDPQLRDNPAKERAGGRGIQFDGLWPYTMQHHAYDKSQPSMIELIKKIRVLTDQYEERFIVAEIGDDKPYELSAEYTKGDKRLHTAYSTGMMGGQHERVKASDIITPVSEERLVNGESWPCWAYCNHDVVRVYTRWGLNNPDDNPNFPKMLMASLACLRGSFCIYQGEELGLKEAVLKFEDLTDPWGIATWPQWQGRDGCRTPIPWDKDSANGGFSNTDDKSWLPVCKKHLPLAVSEQDNNAESMLNFTRELFKWRRDHPLLKFGDIEFCDFGEDVLGFVRYGDEKSYLCVFNLSNTDHALDGIEETNILYGLSSSLEAGTLSLSPFGFAICSFV